MKYQALFIELELLIEMKFKNVNINKDSQMVLKHIIREYKCHNLALAPYFTAIVQLLIEFD